MRLKLIQIVHIARYEMQMHWRGRALRVIMLAVLAMNGLNGVVVRDYAVLTSFNVTASIDALVWTTLGVTFAFLLPIMISDAIPKDRQQGVRELIDSLPVTRSVYLLGKLLGVYVVVFLMLTFTMLVIGIFYRLMLGEFPLRPYLEVWTVGAGALVILNGGLGVLLPATQPNRRRAGVLMVVVLILGFALAGRGFEGDSILTYLNPIRPPLMMYYLTGFAGDKGADLVTQFTREDVWLSNGVGLIELVIVGVAVWAWSRWRESRV
ncbi:MAG: ABC transporter permease [Anaerolineaceae bacterium]|nr:ABC transporter permease [Anaerolineaceae bacterium]